MKSLDLRSVLDNDIGDSHSSNLCWKRSTRSDTKEDIPRGQWQSLDPNFVEE